MSKIILPLKYSEQTGRNERANAQDVMPNEEYLVDTRNLIRLLIKRLIDQNRLDILTEDDQILLKEACALPASY